MAHKYAYTTSQLERALKPKPVLSVASDGAPTPKDLQTWRKHLKSPPKRQRYLFDMALYNLGKHDPEYVVSILKEWESVSTHAFPASWIASRHGSVFGHRCGNERAKHYRTLLEAKDPYIQTAAAVYLTYLDEDVGLKALHNFAKNESSHAGTWAAFTLVRRGDASHMRRILEPLGAHDREAGFLYFRTLVLLSNSCAASGVPMPERVYGPKAPRHYLDWWDTYGEKMTFADPWLPLFKAQHVD